MRRDDGYAIVIALSLVVVIAITLGTYTIITVNNTRTMASSRAASSGFYAAEAALNARAERVRQKFKGFQVPEGTTPSPSRPCQGTNLGNGDFVCENDEVVGRTVTSYVKADEKVNIVIPQGEDFEYLSAEETPFTVYGRAVGSAGNPEAITTLVFRSRLVPLFQFAVFFDKDLEFTNTATLNLSGPVHTNGNLFLDAGSGASLTIRGQTTSAGNIYRGWKHEAQCYAGSIQIANDAGALQSMGSCTGRSQLTTAQMQPFGNQLKTLSELEVPDVEQLQPSSGAEYWTKADVRIVLKRGGSASSPTWTPRFVRTNGSEIPVAGCGAALGTSQTLRDNREAQIWDGGSSPERAQRRTLDVNVRELLACLHNNRAALSLGAGATGIAEESEGGLVLYMTVDDSSGSAILSSVLAGGTGDGISQNLTSTNNYAVRLTNGALLRSSNASHPVPKGVSFVSDQAVFIQGDFNTPEFRSGGWIPSAVMADSVNVLSNDWANNSPCILREDGVNYHMSRTEWRRWNNRPVRKENVTSIQWANSTTLRTKTVNLMGANWHYYTARNFGATVGENAQGDAKSELPLWCRNAQETTIRTAILAGTATTGPTGTAADEGQLYINNPPQSGGVHNMMRFHENWGSNGGHPENRAIEYIYRGSLVSLTRPLHARGTFKLGEQRFYQPPRRQWGFEEQFRDAANLPPLTPRFVYLKQDNFTRQFEQ